MVRTFRDGLKQLLPPKTLPVTGGGRKEGKSQNCRKVDVPWQRGEGQSGPVLDGAPQRAEGRRGASLPAKALDTYLEWAHERRQCNQVRPHSTDCMRMQSSFSEP